MKIKYLNEGVFKTPEQMKNAAERRKTRSAGDYVASLASNTIKIKAQEKLSSIIKKYNINPFVCHNSGEWNAFRGPISFSKLWTADPEYITVDEISKGNNTCLLINVYFYAHAKDIAEIPTFNENVYASYVYMGEKYAPRNVNQYYPWKVQSDIIRDNFANWVKRGIQQEMKISNDSVLQFLYDCDIKLNHICLFGDIDKDIELVFETFPAVEWNDSESIEGFESFLNSLSELFVFENKGDVYFSMAPHKIVEDAAYGKLYKNGKSIDIRNKLISYISKLLKFTTLDEFFNLGLQLPAANIKAAKEDYKIYAKTVKTLFNKRNEYGRTSILERLTNDISMTYWETICYKLANKDVGTWSFFDKRIGKVIIDFLVDRGRSSYSNRRAWVISIRKGNDYNGNKEDICWIDRDNISHNINKYVKRYSNESSMYYCIDWNIHKDQYKDLYEDTQDLIKELIH